MEYVFFSVSLGTNRELKLFPKTHASVWKHALVGPSAVYSAFIWFLLGLSLYVIYVRDW